jgi:hypothetical protein
MLYYLKLLKLLSNLPNKLSSIQFVILNKTSRNTSIYLSYFSYAISLNVGFRLFYLNIFYFRKPGVAFPRDRNNIYYNNNNVFNSLNTRKIKSLKKFNNYLKFKNNLNNKKLNLLNNKLILDKNLNFYYNLNYIKLNSNINKFSIFNNKNSMKSYSINKNFYRFIFNSFNKNLFYYRNLILNKLNNNNLLNKLNNNNLS